MAAIDLDKAQWQQLKVILTEALKLSEADRADMLNHVLASNPSLRERAFEMLQYYDKASRPFGVTEPLSETRAGQTGDGPHPPLEPGTVVGNYQIVRRLGQGGMGVVYLAQDKRLGRQVALKFIAPALRGRRVGSTEQMLAEARSAAVLNHPGIVTFHDVFEARDELVAVMEYVEGRPLTELIADEPLPLGFALRIAGQLADALAYAHGRGIIHCDLKPANIHVLSNGTTKILDFGLARAMSRPSDDLNSTDEPLFGTAGYLSPERLLGREATAASDVFALGVVLYQMLTGVLPFRAENDAQLFLETLTATPAAPSSMVPAIPAEVDDIVERCLAKNARERMQPHELLRELNSVLHDFETSPIPFPSMRADDRSSPPRTTDAVPMAPRQSVAGRVIVAGLGAIGVLTFFGFITSISYNGPLGLVGRFAPESPLVWPVWGVRSLIAVAGLIVIYALAALAIGGASRFAYAASPAIRKLFGRLAARSRQNAQSLQTMPTAMLAPMVLLGQLLVIGLVAWRFQAILTGLDTFLLRTVPGDFWALGPNNRNDQNLLTEMLAAFVLIFGVAWYRLIQRRWRRNERDGQVALWGGIVTLAFSLLIFQVTMFRIVHHNQAERVSYKNERCYAVGRRGNEDLLFCPQRQSPPLDLIVPGGDPDLKRDGAFENIFADVDLRH